MARLMEHGRGSSNRQLQARIHSKSPYQESRRVGWMRGVPPGKGQNIGEDLVGEGTRRWREEGEKGNGLKW